MAAHAYVDRPEKTMFLCEDIQGKLDEDECSQSDFKASRDWFEQFKNQTNLHNIKVTEEAGTSDQPAAENFRPELKKWIEERGYLSKQVLNFDETGLYWKMMSAKTFTLKDEKSTLGFKVLKDCVTLLLGDNAKGDLQLKPLLVYHSENLRALKGLSKTALCDLEIQYQSLTYHTGKPGLCVQLPLSDSTRLRCS